MLSDDLLGGGISQRIIRCLLFLNWEMGGGFNPWESWGGHFMVKYDGVKCSGIEL
jgi:hypothetical protein